MDIKFNYLCVHSLSIILERKKSCLQLHRLNGNLKNILL